MKYQAKALQGEGWRLLGRERRAGRQAHTLVIFDRHAKLPIASGSVPLTIGSTVPVHHNGARPRPRARVRIGRTRTEQARRAGAVGRAAPLPRADRDRVHLTCKPEPELTSAADASGGHSGRRNIPCWLHNT
jgi:hypothetical protein